MSAIIRLFTTFTAFSATILDALRRSGFLHVTGLPVYVNGPRGPYIRYVQAYLDESVPFPFPFWGTGSAFRTFITDDGQVWTQLSGPSDVAPPNVPGLRTIVTSDPADPDASGEFSTEDLCARLRYPYERVRHWPEPFPHGHCAELLQEHGFRRIDGIHIRNRTNGACIRSVDVVTRMPGHWTRFQGRVGLWLPNGELWDADEAPMRDGELKGLIEGHGLAPMGYWNECPHFALRPDEELHPEQLAERERDPELRIDPIRLAVVD